MLHSALRAAVVCRAAVLFLWCDVDHSSSALQLRLDRFQEFFALVELVIRQYLCRLTAQQATRRLKLGHGAPEVDRDYVFTGTGGGLLNVNLLRDRAWYPTLAKAGLRRRVFYQTRHSFASNALAAGEAPPWVGHMLGHTSPEVVFTVYARFIPNKTRRDGSAFLARMVEDVGQPTSQNPVAIRPKYGRHGDG